MGKSEFASVLEPLGGEESAQGRWAGSFNGWQGGAWRILSHWDRPEPQPDPRTARPKPFKPVRAMLRAVI